ncbi:hypothetical protein [Streptomyces sp. NBC_01497]|uniref:hypothetical protein n=1 Tax=Streptomyces sp. NBC_01497 TaxID=2903885 RepID=UPI002E302248|nr:hypothetical protein [Streptomyces sp. NBC_01497]
MPTTDVVLLVRTSFGDEQVYRPLQALAVDDRRFEDLLNQGPAISVTAPPTPATGPAAAALVRGGLVVLERRTPRQPSTADG